MEYSHTFQEIGVKLSDYVFSEDKTIGWVLKGHLLTEGLLERIISAYLPSGEKLIRKGGLTYRQKLELACSFGVLSDEIVLSLRTLNKLRNDCAHELKTRLTIEELEPIGMAFGKEEFSRFKVDSNGDEGAFLENVLSFLVGFLVAECDDVEANHNAKDR